MTIQVRSNEKPQTPSPAAVAENADQAAADQDAGQSKEQAQSSSAPEEENTSEQNESSESEAEGEVIEAKKEGETEEQEKEPARKKGGFQRRIDKLNAQKAQIEQEKEYWRQQALRAASGSNADVNPKIETPSTPDGKPKPESFETHAEYVEALTDWKTDQKLKERDQRLANERITQEQSRLVSSYTERAKAFSDKTPDFQEVLAEVDHIRLSPTLEHILLSSDNGPELAYELAKTPEEFQRIAKLPPTDCAREIGKFEARLNSSSSKASTEAIEKKITKAPKPIEPVGTGGKGSVPKSIFDPNIPQREYEAIRREQIKKRRQAS